MAEVDRRAQILEAALGEFASRGFGGATIKGIAGAAGLNSPALIYWYFPDKESLFREVLESQAPVVRAVAHPETLEGLPLEEVLRTLGQAYLTFDGTNTRRMRLLIGEAVRDPESARHFIEEGPARVLAFLEDHLRRQVEAGSLRPHDTRSSSRAFIGMLLPQVLGKVAFPELVKIGPSDEAHLENVVGIFLRGLAPEV